ncbi:MAG TPA: hypothetical protein VFS67_27975 [Polyangiaceae bacterium]|nr:hypothetical protein [Polyangiaceae bacterium]
MPPESRRRWQNALVLAAGVLGAPAASALPNTHAPAISTWDTRASSVVLGYAHSLGGAGDFTRLSYNANFSSSTGVLSAQFGVHYLTYRDHDDSVLARGFSAGGVALFNFPIGERFSNGVPRSSFDFYVGGVPTALFSGQLNFISVPLVLGIGIPFSPARWLSIQPWAELSPGLNFDTSIQEVSTASAIQSAMDGTLTRAEVEDLVEQGLKITEETTLGKRAGISFTGHLGERVDLNVDFALGAQRHGSASLGAALVVRWDALVVGGERAARAEAEDEARAVPPACAAWQVGLQRCVASPPRVPSRVPPATRAPAAGTRTRARRSAVPRSAPRQQPAAASPAPAPEGSKAPGAARKKPAAPPAAGAAPSPAPAAPGVLPPLQAAPPRAQ